jgi:integrase
MDDARFYVAEYLQGRINRNLSAWTIQRDRSALRKIYQDRQLASEVSVPRRKLKNIKRSRFPVAMDKAFNTENHRDMIDFANATGLRRHEMLLMTPSDVYWKDEILYVHIRQGKGGKPREATVVAGMEERILEIIQGLEPNQLIFQSIPIRMDVHSYRREYSFARQEQVSELETSHDLGHNRVDVIRGHYSRIKW